MFRKMLLCLLVSLYILTSLASAEEKKNWKYYRTGNAEDKVSQPKPSFFLQGGNDLDDAFRWFCDHADGGDVLVLRARGGDGYNSYIQGLCHVNSVASLVIPSREAAEDPFVANTIRHAEAIFIAGGDQANYINFWKGTAVQRELNNAIARGIPFGGNSAGLAVLGEYVFAALYDTTDSETTLKDPFHKTVTMENDFLKIPLLRGVLTDTHFAKRNRMGRLMVFLARLHVDGGPERIRAIAVDEGSAVMIEPDGNAITMGNKPAYFVESTTSPQICKPGTPLTYGPLSVYRTTKTASFNVKTWSGENGIAYELTARQGVVASTQSKGGLY